MPHARIDVDLKIILFEQLITTAYKYVSFVYLFLCVLYVKLCVYVCICMCVCACLCVCACVSAQCLYRWLLHPLKFDFGPYHHVHWVILLWKRDALKRQPVPRGSKSRSRSKKVNFEKLCKLVVWQVKRCLLTWELSWCLYIFSNFNCSWDILIFAVLSHIVKYTLFAVFRPLFGQLPI